MTRNLKVLGLALVAVLAMSAMVASAASAATFTATAGAKITAVDTAGSVTLTVTGQEVFCKEIAFTGIAPAASFTQIAVNATYKECTTGAGVTATVRGFGQHGEAQPCNFVLYAAGTADLVCPTGQDVTISAGSCVVHIPAQVGLGTIVYTSNHAAGDVDIHLDVTKITGTHTDGFLCPFGSSGHSSESLLETFDSWPLTAVASVGTLTWDK